MYITKIYLSLHTINYLHSGTPVSRYASILIRLNKIIFKHQRTHIKAPLIKINTSLNCTLFKVYIKVHNIAFKLCFNIKNTVYSENIIYVKIQHKLLRQNELVENISWLSRSTIHSISSNTQTFGHLELYIYQINVFRIWSVCVECVSGKGQRKTYHIQVSWGSSPLCGCSLVHNNLMSGFFFAKPLRRFWLDTATSLRGL